MNELENICLRILPSTKLDLIRDLSVALIEASRVAGVRPEDPGIRRSLCGAVAVLDGQLRLPIPTLGARTNQRVSLLLTPRRPDPPALLSTPAQSIFCLSDGAACRGRRSLRRDGKGRTMKGGVEFRRVLREQSMVSVLVALVTAEASTCQPAHGRVSRWNQSCFRLADPGFPHLRT